MKLILVCLALIQVLWSADATLEVVKGVEAQPKLAIEDASPYSSETTQKMSKMLVADMNVVSLFDVDESYAVSSYENGSPASVHKNTQYLLKYRLISDGSGGMKADVRLIQNGMDLFTKSYVLKQTEMLVFLSHLIAYDINAKMGGAPMEWIKRKVLMVRLSGPRRSEIVAADYTLSYQKVVMAGGMFGFAKWADAAQTEFYYTSLSDKQPSVYKMNLLTGERTHIISSDGMAVCSDVSSDGRKLLLTLAPTGQPDIFLYDTVTRGKTRLTDFSGIDVSGKFLGDDSIAFVSNRLGYPNIFSKKIDSSAVNQIVHSGKNNSTMTTHKNFLVYKARENSGFNLHLLSMNGGASKRLTAGGDNDFPCFSPDGEAILFIKQDRTTSSVGIIRLTLNKSFAFPLKIGRLQSIDW